MKSCEAIARLLGSQVDGRYSLSACELFPFPVSSLFAKWLIGLHSLNKSSLFLPYLFVVCPVFWLSVMFSYCRPCYYSWDRRGRMWKEKRNKLVKVSLGLFRQDISITTLRHEVSNSSNHRTIFILPKLIEVCIIISEGFAGTNFIPII